MAVDDRPRERSRMLFDEQVQARRLSEIYAPLFTLILQLRASSAYGDAEVLRRRIKDLLDQVEREARRVGYADDDLKAARFALVAFVDETLLLSEWPEKARWVAKPLQLEFYERYDAGEVFFERLQHLLGQPVAHAEVLEVYYLCMALGFKGRYQLHDQERLRLLIEETFQALSRTPGLGADTLSPHGTPRDQMAAEVRSRLPAWMIAVFALLIAAVLYLGMSLYLSSQANRTAEAIDQVPRTEAGP